MKKAEERRAHRPTRSVPPIVDQDVEWRQGSNRVPPHVGNEYGIAGLEFSDLSRSGGPLEARKAREVGIVDIDQADRHTLRGEFEGSDVEILQLLRRKQHKSAAPRGDAGDVVIEVEMRGNRQCVADPRRRLRTQRRQVKPVLQIEERQM